VPLDFCRVFHSVLSLLCCTTVQSPLNSGEVLENKFAEV